MPAAVGGEPAAVLLEDRAADGKAQAQPADSGGWWKYPPAPARRRCCGKTSGSMPMPVSLHLDDQLRPAYVRRNQHRRLREPTVTGRPRG